jgi:hypothetical protein
MRRAQLKKLPTEHLIEKARAASAERWRAISEGRTREGNRLYDLLVEIRRELRARGEEAQRQLLVLLDDPEPGTRCWAAASVLEFAPAEGERVLAELAKIPKSLVGFSAELTLEQWKAGTFNPP